MGVGFEKTRNLKLVTQNFFVPLHPEIGQDAPTVRLPPSLFVHHALRDSTASVDDLRFKWPAGVLSPLNYESGRAERNALRAFKWYKIEIS